MTGAEPVLFGLTGGQLAIVGAVAAGAGVQAYGSYQQGQQAQQQAKAEAAWHQYNASVARKQQAQKEAAEREQTAFETKQHRRQAEQLLSRQRSLIGASGVNIEGSPLLVAEDTAAQLRLEEVNIMKQSQRRLQGLGAYESQAILDESMASASKAKGAAAGRAGAMSAIGTSLMGAGQAGYTGYKLRT